MNVAPVVLFAYNRPGHTMKTVEALRLNEEAAQSDLIVYADGAKNVDDAGSVQEVRRYLHSITGFRTVTVIEREQNLGLARSIIGGVTETLSRFDRVIVLEDDLVTSPFFLRYMNEALQLYRGEEEVISVHGYLYPAPGRFPDTFFLRGADCWGWGTWRRGWDLFETDGAKLLEELQWRRLTRAFDMWGAFPYTRMLKGQIAGRNDSWAIRWHASAFLQGKLTLYPGCTLVRNIGHDASGTNCARTEVFDAAVAKHPVDVRSIAPAEDLRARDLVRDYFWSLQPLLKRLLRRVLECCA